MKTEYLPDHEKARKINKQLRHAIQNTGRDHVRSVLKINEGTVSKFMSGQHPDCKINIESISELIASLGFKLAPTDSTICPRGYIPICKQKLSGLYTDAMVGRLSDGIAWEKEGVPIKGRMIFKAVLEAMENGALEDDAEG